MCFTFLGRVQTRLLSLVFPLVVTILFTAVSGNSDYVRLLNLMVLIGFALDLAVYSWLIRYQPRWLTIALGAVEFLLITAVVEWGALFNVQLLLSQALVFYLVAWLGAWVTTQAVLPVLVPRWAEDGGEIRYTVALEQAKDGHLPFAVVMMLLMACLLIGIFFTTNR